MSSTIDTSTGIGGLLYPNAFRRFGPEPVNRLADGFSSILTGIKTIASASYAGCGGAAAGIDPFYADLLERQLEAQVQMQLVSMESNVEKSRHETQMAAIRNIRVG